MPTNTPAKRAKEKPKGGKGGLNRKLGPLPVYGWVVAAVGAYLVYHFLIGKSTSATTPSSGPLGTGTDTSGSTGGASGASGDASGGGFDAYANLVNALLSSNAANLDAFKEAIAGGTSSVAPSTVVWPEGPAGPAGAAAPAGSPVVVASPYAVAPQGTKVTFQGTTYDVSGQRPVAPGNYNPNSPQGVRAVNIEIGRTEPPPAPVSAGSGGSVFTSVGNAIDYQHLVPASSSNFAAQSVAKTQAAQAAQAPVAFGGVVNVKRLPNGSTLTTYASGRQVQQAPGHSAYVVKA